jgi:H+/Cl- antiporter ClcA
MVIPERPFSKWELIIFAFIGYVSGHAAHFFLKVHQKFNVTLRPYTKAHPLVNTMM